MNWLATGAVGFCLGCYFMVLIQLLLTRGWDDPIRKIDNSIQRRALRRLRRKGVH